MKSVVVAVLALGALAGCSAEPVATPAPTVAPITAADTCASVSDVLTIIANAQTAYSQKRSSAQEFDGAMQLAARIMSRVQVADGTDLARAVTTGRDVATATPIGRVGPVLNPNSSQWVGAVTGMADACEASGTPLGISAWSGG